MQPLVDALAALETLRGSRVLLYVTDDRAAPPKSIDDEDVLPLYDALRAVPPTDRLDLVLYTNGGRVNVSRKIALLLRDRAPHLDVLVPYKARSAGTLLCLAADQIVMSDLAELGPIDPQIMAAGDALAGGPQAVSSEDVRALRAMADSWFGIQGDADRSQLLRLLTERIFPTSLSAFFRADQQMRQVAAELLRYQLSAAEEHARQRIVDRLVSGFHAHDYAITRIEAQHLGLRVRPPSPAEDALLWTIWQGSTAQLAASNATQEDPGVSERVDGIILSTTFCARHVTRSRAFLATGGQGVHMGQMMHTIVEARWQAP
jgi:hypothetical protein